MANKNEGTGIQIEPLSLELVVGENAPVSNGTIRFKNLSTIPQFVTFSAVDVRSGDSEGNVDFLSNPVGGGQAVLSNFVQLATSSAKLDPQQEVMLGVHVQNLQSLPPGGHYAAVVARFSNSSSVLDTQVLPAVSGLLLIRKTGGERYHISLIDVEYSPQHLLLSLPSTLRLTFRNEGNVHLVPHGTIEFIDLRGRVIKKGIINDSSKVVLPQNRRQLSQSVYEVEPSFPIMVYKVKIQGSTNPGDVPFGREFSFLYISLPTIIIFSVIALISFAIIGRIFLWRKRR